METPTKEQIIDRRKEIEQKLLELLKKTKGEFGLDDIKKIIYNEDGQDDLTKIIARFDNGQELVEINELLEIINDAWNYFPHKCLEGLCPMEKLLEYKFKDKRI